MGHFRDFAVCPEDGYTPSISTEDTMEAGNIHRIVMTFFQSSLAFPLKNPSVTAFLYFPTRQCIDCPFRTHFRPPLRGPKSPRKTTLKCDEKCWSTEGGKMRILLKTRWTPFLDTIDFSTTTAIPYGST